MNILDENSLKSHIHAKYSHDAECFAITGSHAAGLATHRSDIDAVLIPHRSSKLSERNGQVISDSVQKTLLEITVLNSDEIANITSDASNATFQTLDEEKIILTERLVTSRPIHGCERWIALTSQLDKTVYTKALFEYYQQLFANYLDDAFGAADLCDWPTAADGMRNSIASICESLLASRGDTYGRQKWIAKRLLRLPEINVDDQRHFLDVYFNAPVQDSGAFSVWWLRACSLIQSISRKVLLTDKHEVEWRPTSANSDLYSTAHELFVLNFGGVHFMKTRDDNAVLDPLAAEILLRYMVPSDVSAISRPGIKSSTSSSSDGADAVEVLQHLINNNLILPMK